MVFHQLSLASRQALDKVYHDLDNVILSRIEAAVYDAKKGDGPVNRQESHRLPEK